LTPPRKARLDGIAAKSDARANGTTFDLANLEGALVLVRLGGRLELRSISMRFCTNRKRLSPT